MKSLLRFVLILANGIPEGYRVQFINGFVEELVMNDDPEYQWIDKIRTPRASNEARCQCYKTFFPLSLMMRPNKLQRLSLETLLSQVL